MIRGRFTILLLFVTLVCTVSFSTAAQNKPVYVIPVEGTIEPGLAEFIKRSLDEAQSAGAAAVLLEINTFGGRVDAATEIRDAIMAMPTTVIAFVTERAWSAGALISLSAHKLAMSSRSSIGAAEPRPAEEKIISALKAEFEATAEGQGRDPKVAAAMVDKDVAIEGLVESGKILSLAAADAKRIGFVDLVAESRAEVLEHFELAEAPLVVTSPNWAERIARFVTEPTVSSGLLTLGFLGLLLELFTAGFGVAGAIGILALGLFFGGRMVAGLAGTETVLLFVVGVALLALEAFVIPGFGVAGLAGLGAIFGSIVTSYANTRVAVYSLSTAIVLSGVLFAVLSRYLRKSRTWDKLVLKTRQNKQEGYVSTAGRQELVGQVGITLTTCRPAGTVLVGNERLDAVSEGPYIDARVPVQIVGVSSAQVVVREIEDHLEGKGL